MEFIKTHKTSLIIGASCFVIGYISGGIMEARSIQKQLAQNIFSQVSNQQKRMRDNRSSDEQRSIAMGHKTVARNVEGLTRNVSEVSKRTRDLEMSLSDLKDRFERVQKKQTVLFKEHLNRKEPDSIFNKAQKAD